MAAVYFDTSVFTQPSYRRIAKATPGGRGILLELTILMWDQPGKRLLAKDLSEHADTLGVDAGAVQAVVKAALKEGLWYGSDTLHSALVDEQSEGLRRRTKFLKQNLNQSSVTDAVTDTVTDTVTAIVTRSDKIRSDKTRSDQTRQDKTEPEAGPLRDWWEYRKQLKKPLTRAGLERIRAKYSENPNALRLAVNHSIEKGYQGLFEPPPPNGKNKSTFDHNLELLERIRREEAGEGAP